MKKTGSSTGNPVEPSQRSDRSDDARPLVKLGKGASLAWGPRARAISIHIGRINITLSLLPVVIVLSLVVAALLFVLLHGGRPKAMTGRFNVAVAEFESRDQSGARIRSQDGANLARYVHGELEENLPDLGLSKSDLDLWPPGWTGRVKGQTADERRAAAKDLTERIAADVVIYGVISETNRGPRFVPEFYVRSEGFEDAKEIIGPHMLGSPLYVPLPFKHDLAFESSALVARVEALSAITAGLAYYAGAKYQAAIDHFAQATEREWWGDEDVQRVVHVLMGNAAGRLAVTEKDPDRLKAGLDAALAFYQSVLDLNRDDMRAKAGKASILFTKANPLATGSPPCAWDWPMVNEAQALYESVRATEDRPQSAVLEAKISLGLGQVYFVRAVCDGEGELAEAEAEFDRVVQAYKDGNQDLSDLAGHAYARLGAVARLQKDDPTSAERYHRAIELVSPYYQARYWGELGDMHKEACEIELAIQAYEQARDIAGDTGDYESAEQYDQELKKLEQGCPTATDRRDLGL